MALSSAFASQSRAKAVHVRSQLPTLRKGGRAYGNLSIPRGRGRYPFHSNREGDCDNTSILFQLCDNPGHTTFRCWKRFDPNFQTPSPLPCPNPQANLASNRS